MSTGGGVKYPPRDDRVCLYNVLPIGWESPQSNTHRYGPFNRRPPAIQQGRCWSSQLLFIRLFFTQVMLGQDRIFFICLLYKQYIY